MAEALRLAATFLVAAVSIAYPQSTPDQGKTATISLQMAIVSTGQGQTASALLTAQWAPELAALETKQVEIKAEQEKLERQSKRRRGWWPFRHAMSRKQQAIEVRKIQEKAKALQRERDDDRAAFENERKRIFNDLGSKMHALLEDYARDHGYSAVIEAGNPQSPVVVTRNDITEEIVTLYNQVYPAAP
jgi:outer membrane protein